jgi:hypothetical protein
MMTEPLNQLSEATRQTVARVAEALSTETEALAVLLTGPHALGIDRAEDKMYFVSITEAGDGVIEHRFVESYAEIERPMEIGVFPRLFVDRLASDGYWDMVTLRAAEALRLGIPVVDPTGYGRDAAHAMAKYLPEKRFISGAIHRVIATFDDAVSLHAKGDHAGAVLVAREALRLAVELVRKSSGASEDTPIDEVIRAELGDEAYRCLLRATGVEGMDAEKVRSHLATLTGLSRSILEDLGISAGFLEE